MELLSWSRPPQCEVWPTEVVFALPCGEGIGELAEQSALDPPIEFLGVRAVAARDLPVALRIAAGDAAMIDPQVAQVPGEIPAKLAAVVGLDALQRGWEHLADFVEEGDRALGGIVIVDAQDAEATRFIDRGELIELQIPTDPLRNELHVDLEAFPGRPGWRELAGWPAAPIPREAVDMVAFQDLEDRRGRHVNVMVALEMEGDPRSSVLFVPTDLEDDRDDFWRNLEADHVRTPRPVTQTDFAVLLNRRNHR